MFVLGWGSEVGEGDGVDICKASATVEGVAAAQGSLSLPHSPSMASGDVMLKSAPRTGWVVTALL